MKNLVRIIGDSVTLYKLVLQYSITLFINTSYPYYCSMRNDLLMSFHDANASAVCTQSSSFFLKLSLIFPEFFLIFLLNNIF